MVSMQTCNCRIECKFWWNAILVVFLKNYCGKNHYCVTTRYVFGWSNLLIEQHALLKELTFFWKNYQVHCVQSAKSTKQTRCITEKMKLFCKKLQSPLRPVSGIHRADNVWYWKYIFFRKNFQVHSVQSAESAERTTCDTEKINIFFEKITKSTLSGQRNPPTGQQVICGHNIWICVKKNEMST